MARRTKRAKSSREACLGHAVAAIQGQIVKMSGMFIFNSTTRPAKSLWSLEKQVKDFIRKNKAGFSEFKACHQQDTNLAELATTPIPEPFDANICFSAVEYSDYRPYRILFTTDKKKVAKSKSRSMSPGAATELLSKIGQDLAHLYGAGWEDHWAITEVSLLGFGAVTQPYHMDDKAKCPPSDCEFQRQSGSLVYNLTQKGDPVGIKVLQMGEGGYGYCAYTQVIHEDQALWFDDWVVHAGDQHDGASVRMHVHVDVLSNAERVAKKVYVLSEVEVDKMYKKQALFPHERMLFPRK